MEFLPRDKLLLNVGKLHLFSIGQDFAPSLVEISPTNDCNAKCPWCLVEGTLIATLDGDVPIERIRPGDRVYGPDWSVCTVTSIGNRLVEEILVIRCGDHEIRTSKDHPFLAGEGWKDADALRVGDAAVVRVRLRGSRSDSGLFIEGIHLERGLELRHVDSIRRIAGRCRVYNFSCQPLESYEANGFVVHNCFYVSSEYKQHHSKDELGENVLSLLLADLAKMGVPAVTWTGGGDPSVYTFIDDAIDRAHSLGIKQGMFTNAYKPIRSPEKLAWIRVTVTEKFLVSKHVARYAKATKTGVNFNLCAENEQHLRPMVEQARSAGCAYFQVRPALADRWDLQKPVTTPEWLKNFQTESFRVVLTPYKFEDHASPHDYPICHGHRFVPTVWHNGDVAVCGYHFGRDQFTFGNLQTQSFQEIWLGQKRAKMLKDGVPVIEDCQHCCKHNEINKTLAIIRREALVPDDKEFI